MVLTNSWKSKGEKFWREATPKDFQELLNSGVDVNERSKHGETMLHMVAHYNENPEVIVTLLKAGANLEACCASGYTPLHVTAAWRNSKMTSILLNSGANVHAQNEEKNTPLHEAATHNENPDVIMVLLKAGAKGWAKNKDGKKPFDLAKENKFIKDTDAYWALNDAQYK